MQVQGRLKRGAPKRCIWLDRRPLAELEQGQEIVGPRGPPTTINISSAQAPNVPPALAGFPGRVLGRVHPTRERPHGALASLFS